MTTTDPAYFCASFTFGIYQGTGMSEYGISDRNVTKHVVNVHVCTVMVARGQLANQAGLPYLTGTSPQIKTPAAYIPYGRVPTAKQHRKNKTINGCVNSPAGLWDSVGPNRWPTADSSGDSATNDYSRSCSAACLLLPPTRFRRKMGPCRSTFWRNQAPIH